MTDIFVSYATEDRERVRPLVEVLEAEGWSIFWDREIPPGRSWDDVIQETLDEAQCVVAVWTRHSVESRWVKIEAMEGLEREILVPVVLDDAEIPIAFRRTQAADLRDPSPANPELDRFLRAVHRAMGSTHKPARPARRTASWIRDKTLIGYGLVATAVLVVGLLSLATWLATRSELPASLPLERQVVKFQLLPPDGLEFGEMSVSPDGRHLAFTAADPAGKAQLWLRPLDSLTGALLPGTEEASSPFWSPDSRFIAFFAGNKLKRIDPFGGPAQTVCTLPKLRGGGIGGAMGGSWSPNGVIIFAVWPLGPAPLYQVSAAGGEPRAMTTVEGFSDRGQRRAPVFLPDGRHFLYLAISDVDSDLTGIYLGSLDAAEARLLVRAGTSAAYAADPAGGDGHLVFVKERTLVAQPFDPRRLVTTGDSVPLAERIGVDMNLRSRISVSENGVLVYSTGSGAIELRWFDRAGVSHGALGPRGSHIDFRISPDGHRVADQREEEPGRADIFLLDPERGTSERLTFEPTYYAAPVWTPDGSSLTFFTTRDGRWSIWEKATNGMGTERQLFSSENDVVPNDWSSDGKFLLYTEVTPDTRAVWVLAGEGAPGDEPRRTPFVGIGGLGRFSPDGKWVVYTSNQSGRNEIYVRPFPADDAGPGGKLISTHGGTEPRWPRGGKEIFYIGPNDMLMAVPVTTGATLEAGIPRSLFRMRPVSSVLRYDVTADGERFLVATPVDDRVFAPMTVVLNWSAELDRRGP